MYVDDYGSYQTVMPTHREPSHRLHGKEYFNDDWNNVVRTMINEVCEELGLQIVKNRILIPSGWNVRCVDIIWSDDGVDWHEVQYSHGNVPNDNGSRQYCDLRAITIDTCEERSLLSVSGVRYTTLCWESNVVGVEEMTKSFLEKKLKEQTESVRELFYHTLVRCKG